MAKYADWYAVELDGYLKGRMSDVDRFESVKEIMSHLAEHVEDLIAKGMGQIQAEKAAIASFGTPRDAALNLVNQGPRWRFGGIFSSLAMLTFIASIVLSGIIFRAFSLHLSYAHNLKYGLAGLIVAVVVFMLIGGFLSRKAEYKKLAFGWLAGMAITTGVLVFGPQPTFANVPQDKFPDQLASWKSGWEATKKIGDLQRQLAANFSDQVYDNGYYRLAQKDKAKALEAIKKITPQLLEVKPSYVQVKGKLTSGYLVPATRNGMDSYYFRSRYNYSFDDAFNSPTGGYLPWTYLNLAYVESADKALDAWGHRLSIYGRSEFEQIASDQEAFIANAETISKMSVGQMAIATLLPLAGSSLVFLVLAWAASLIACKVPTLVFFTSFRRRLA